VYAADHAKEHPDQPAIIMAPSGRTLTFAEYEAAANQVAHVLRETGLRKGDHVAIFMENHPAMLLAEAGAERTGLYFTPVNSYLSAEEVAYVINDSRSRVVVTSTAKAEVAAQLPALCPDVDRFIMVDTTSGPGGGRRRHRRLRVVGRHRRRALHGPCPGRADGRPHDVFVRHDGATQRHPPPHVRHPSLRDQHRRPRDRRAVAAA
jgi:acyl-coenzyme A synthetase/AMP-(fatty) acid ligase